MMTVITESMSSADDTPIVLNFDSLPAAGSFSGSIIPDEAKLSTQYLSAFGVSFA